MSGTDPPNKNKNPADGLKKAFEKLNNEVKNLGMVLGVKEESPVTKNDPATTNDADKNQYQKDMTQDEKKAQRAAKAAEKKAKAEKAAAKKLSGETAAGSEKQQQQNQKAKKDENKKPQENGNQQKKEKSPENEDRIDDVVDITKGLQNLHVSDKDVKSVLKRGNHKENHKVHHQNGATNKEVQFDLQANTTNHVVQSESDEAFASTIPEPPVVPLEDASAIAHIHPSFITLSVRCEKELVKDVEQVCQEFITNFKEFLNDWTSERIRSKGDPSTFGHDLDLAIRPQLGYLTQSGRWPLPYALGNIVRQLKREVQNCKEGTNEEQAEVIQDHLDYALVANFEAAYNAISTYIRPKFKGSTCVLTYDWCPVVNHVLLDSMKTYPNLRVCFVDPELNGRGIQHVNSFVERGYKCQYTDLKSIGNVVPQCQIVVIGCSAILSNGCVAASKGAIQLALTAKSFNVPVLVVSQYFKFVDKVQSYPRMALLGRESVELIPSTLVTAVVTDIRILPPTAAPAVLKAKALDLN